MKVLLLSGEYPPYLFGGGATFMYHLAKGLTEKGIDVTIIAHKLVSLLKNEAKTEDISGYRNGKRIIWVSVPSFLHPRHSYFQLLAKNIVNKLIDQHDIIHLNTGLYYPWLQRIIQQKGRERAIVTIHSDPIEICKIVAMDSHVSIKDRLFACLHMSEANIALERELKELHPVFVSKSLYESLRKKYSIKSYYSIIHNGIDFSYIDKVISTSSKLKLFNIITKAKKHGYKILVYPARFHPIKNHVTLIRIFYYLQKNYNFKGLLILIGDGPTKTNVINKAKRMKILKYTLFPGKLPYDETLKILSLADLVPFVSIYEANPISIIEALYLGKPVITFDSPYAKEIQTYCASSSNIVLARNIDNFIEKTLEILSSNPSKKSMISSCISEFSNDSMIQKYVKLYKKLLKII